MFSRSCLKHNHYLDTKHIILLHNIGKGKKMYLLDILEIKKVIKNKIVTNGVTEFFVSPLLKAAI